MIDYEYTAVNRLDTPHKYMYASYQGGEFLEAYFRDRLKHIEDFKQTQDWQYKNKVDLSLHSRAVIFLKAFIDGEIVNELDESLRAIIDWKSIVKVNDSFVDNVDTNIFSLSSFSIRDAVNSKNLLISLLHSQLNNEDDSLVKYWLDLLVQRFEVTKKIYESYPSNFSKGEGNSDTVILYWLFALSLTIFYCYVKNIKYLSTLLKTTDLLCSLERATLRQKIPPQGLSLVLLVELLSVKELSPTIEYKL